MKTIKLDGSTLCTIFRDENGVHIAMRENMGNELESDKYKEIPISELPKEIDLTIDICDKTYVMLCKCLLAFAERHEMVEIIKNPIGGSCFTPK